MKAKQNLEHLSALSLGRSAAAGAQGSGANPFQPRLTPESVRDFNVREAGSADNDLPQPDRLGTTRPCATARTLTVKFVRTQFWCHVLPV